MRSRIASLWLAALATAVVVAACAPVTETPMEPGVCVSANRPVIAVIDFENTAGASGGTTVIGVEEAAAARLITLLKESDCYVIVERSELIGIMEQQGLESMDPVSLARAAGAGYVVTGVVTRATIAAPQVAAFGVSLGATRAQVEIDVRATDIITGEVVVSKIGAGEASNPNISVSHLIGTSVSYNDPTVGPLLAQAANTAVTQVVNAIRTAF